MEHDYMDWTTIGVDAKFRDEVEVWLSENLKGGRKIIPWMDTIHVQIEIPEEAMLFKLAWG
jgi:hypothetical protein